MQAPRYTAGAEKEFFRAGRYTTTECQAILVPAPTHYSLQLQRRGANPGAALSTAPGPVFRNNNNNSCLRVSQRGAGKLVSIKVRAGSSRIAHEEYHTRRTTRPPPARVPALTGKLVSVKVRAGGRSRVRPRCTDVLYSGRASLATSSSTHSREMGRSSSLLPVKTRALLTSPSSPGRVSTTLPSFQSSRGAV